MKIEFFHNPAIDKFPLLVANFLPLFETIGLKFAVDVEFVDVSKANLAVVVEKTDSNSQFLPLLILPKNDWTRFNDQIQFVTNLDMHITDQIWSTNGNCQSFKKVLLASRLVLNRQLWQLLALHLCAPFLEMKSVWLVSKAFIDFSPVVYSYFLCSKEPDHDQRERERQISKQAKKVQCSSDCPLQRVKLIFIRLKNLEAFPNSFFAHAYVFGSQFGTFESIL